MNIRAIIGAVGGIFARLREKLAGRRGGLYYINGQTALPPPLTAAE